MSRGLPNGFDQLGSDGIPPVTGLAPPQRLDTSSHSSPIKPLGVPRHLDSAHPQLWGPGDSHGAQLEAAGDPGPFSVCRR